MILPAACYTTGQTEHHLGNNKPLQSSNPYHPGSDAVVTFRMREEWARTGDYQLPRVRYRAAKISPGVARTTAPENPTVDHFPRRSGTSLPSFRFA